MVELPLPATMDVGLALTEERAGSGAAATTVTTGCRLRATPPAMAETVLSPATVELSIPVVTPSTPEGPGWTIVFPDPVADSATGTPLIGAPLASSTVTVIVETLSPAGSVSGDAVTVERDAAPLAIVTVIPAEVVEFPAASRATAVRTCVPFAAALESQDMVNLVRGDSAVTSDPMSPPSSRNWTPATSRSSTAVAVRVTIASSDAPSSGATMDTIGGPTSASAAG